MLGLVCTNDGSVRVGGATSGDWLGVTLVGWDEGAGYDTGGGGGSSVGLEDLTMIAGGE